MYLQLLSVLWIYYISKGAEFIETVSSKLLIIITGTGNLLSANFFIGSRLCNEKCVTLF